MAGTTADKNRDKLITELLGLVETLKPVLDKYGKTTALPTAIGRQTTALNRQATVLKAIGDHLERVNARLTVGHPTPSDEARRSKAAYQTVRSTLLHVGHRALPYVAADWTGGIVSKLQWRDATSLEGLYLYALQISGGEPIDEVQPINNCQATFATLDSGQPIRRIEVRKKTDGTALAVGGSLRPM